MTLTWEVAAAATVVLGGIITGQVAIVRWLIRVEHGKLLTAMNGKYVRSELCGERHSSCRADLIHRINQLQPQAETE